MKLSKQQVKELQKILIDLKKSRQFILKPETIIATQTAMTGAKEDTWSNLSSGKQAIAFNKIVGNDLCYLYNGITQLTDFLNNHTQTKELDKYEALNAFIK